MIEVSARHVHVTQTDLEALFGKDHPLTVRKELSQPGEFASEERVTVVGPKREIANVLILGPCRAHSQVELSLTDCRSIGIATLVRESGDTDGTPGCKLVGPCGEVELKDGVIAAKRHVHMTDADAEKYGLRNHQIISVRIETDARTLTFGDVVARVSPKFRLAMHIDTDEGNAAGIAGDITGEITFS